MNLQRQQDMGPGAQLPISCCGVENASCIWSQPVTDIDTWEFIGLTPLF